MPPLPADRRGGGRLRRRVAVLAATAGLAVAAAPLAAAGPAAAAVPPSLTATLAKASQLSNQIDSLGQQYDGLKIQLTQAQGEVTAARRMAARDGKLLAASRMAVGRIAAASYMDGGVSTTLQLLQGSAPQQVLSRDSIMAQLQLQNGTRVSAAQSAQSAAHRAQLAAQQASQHATRLRAAIRVKVAAIRAKEKILNSRAFSQALAIYQRTHKYPNISVGGSTIGAQALRWALTRIGKPYVWGAAGPDAFDCSGLVMWSYAHVGISLEHFTGDQWNEGQHIPRSQLRPGDLVFFFANESHVGMYVGHNLMVDAPSAGQNVQIQPIFWDAFVGAVRIG